MDWRSGRSGNSCGAFECLFDVAMCQDQQNIRQGRMRMDENCRSLGYNTGPNHH